MINASFSSSGRDAAISGAYQYDTGQRLRMHGLPSPSELAERDDFLSGDKVTVQVQYAFVGDSQTEASIAEWVEDGEGNGYWLAKVPDVYMLRNADVHVYVYVSYGQTETSMRSKTVYEAVFRPISRPAPSTSVTPDQTNDWDRLVVEINTATGQAKDAAGLANGATVTATEAANAANAAADNANEAATATNDALDVYVTMVDNMQVAATPLAAYVKPTVDIENVTEGGKRFKKITFGIPQSVVKVNDKEADADGNITLTPEDIRANVKEFFAELPSNVSWTGYSDSPFSTCTIDAVGVLADDKPVIDIDFAKLNGLSEEDISGVLESWNKVVRVTAKNNAITLYCLSDFCEAPLPLRILCVR